MPPPSQLAIDTSSVNRLVKEEASYYKELESQQARIARLDQDDENAEFTMKQERRAIDETKAIFPRLQIRIKETLTKLEAQLEQSKSDDQTKPEEIAKAQDAVSSAKKAIKEIA